MPSSSTTPSSRPLNPAFNLILFLVKIILDMMYSLKSITFSSRPVTSSTTLKPSATTSLKPYDPSNETDNDNDTTHHSTSPKEVSDDLDLPPQYDDLTSTLPTLPSCHDHPNPTTDSDSASEVDPEDLNQTSSESDSPSLPLADSLSEKALQLKKMTWSDAGLPGLFLRSCKTPLPSVPVTHEISAVSESVPAVDVAVRTPAAPVQDNTVPVTFTVQYPDSLASNLYLTGSLPSLKSWSPHNAIPMTRTGVNGVWNVTLPLPPSTPFEYKYIQKPHPSHIVWDNGPNRRSTSLSPASTPKTDNSTETIHVTFQVYAETVWGEHILLTGSSPSLRSWSPNSAIALSTSPAQYPMWSVTVPLKSNAEKPLEFKFIRKHEHREGVWWESGTNRVAELKGGGERAVLADGVWRW